MSTVKTVKYQVGTDGTSTNNFTIYQPDPPDGTMRVGNGNAGAATDVAKVDGTGFKFTNSIQIGTDATSTNNFTIYQPSTPDGTLRIGVGNADSPTEVGRFDSNGYVATNLPAFAVGLSADQSISSATYTKVTLNTEDFDTTNNFDSSTNYRFQPTIAGYYQINATMRFEGTNMINNTVAIYKNGSQNRILGTNRVTVSSPVSISGGHVIYLNGTTDYIELYGYVSGTSLVFGVAGTVNNCHMSGSLIRAV